MDILWILHGYAVKDDTFELNPFCGSFRATPFRMTKPEVKPIWNKTWIKPLEIRNEVTQAAKGMFYGKCNKRLKFVLQRTFAYADS